MRMLSGRMHWLTVGLALLVSAHGFATKRLHGQAPLSPMAAQGQGMPPGMMPGGVMPAGGGMMMPDRPMSMVMEGPPPMDVAYADSCQSCGGSRCGGRGCGLMDNMRRCGMCGGAGCGECGGRGHLFGGRVLGLLGALAPYSEGGRGAERWFDLSVGAIGLQRTSDFGGFATPNRDPVTGVFARSELISTNGINGTPVLRSTDIDLDKMRYGLEVNAALQLGPGGGLEARYFGLNNWEVNRTVQPSLVTPNLYSVYSLYGTAPPAGFDDTDRSFIHGITYNSELHNGEVNYRRRFVGPSGWTQGSWLAGVRYFDLDERFSFNAIGSNNNTFTFDQLRFFNQDTITRNQLTGFQMGGDFWVNLVPGIQAGVESKGGIFGNHAEVETQVFSNSIPRATEHLQDGRTAYMGELTASLVYRLTYSWSLRTSYNLLYVDNVALAPENFNTRDISNALGGGAFTLDRFPFIETDGEVVYQGWSISGEYLW